jgi:YidC/Oxa1 family membrane protein insertase
VFNVLSQNETWKSLQTVSMTIPTGLFGTWQVFKQNNGLFILPVLACVTQFLMSAGQNQQQPTPDNGKGTGNFMKYFFPLITLFFCFSYNAAFALYWVVSNIYAWIETIVLNKVIEKKDKEETAVIEEDGIK